MQEGEIRALISLLDDPDDTIFEQIKSKIIDLGDEAVPYLETAWEHENWGLDFQGRIENILHTIQIQNVTSGLLEWRNSPGQDLLEGMLLIAQYQYPDVDKKKVRDKIELLQNDVWLELNNGLTALEKVQVINHVLFEVHGITANTTNYHSPHNSFINEVLDSKKGNPLSISIIYAIVGQKHGIPLKGINLPRHFVLAYQDIDPYNPIIDTNNVLFYINPFSKGAVFSKREVIHFLEQLKLDPKPEYFTPCTNVEIIIRVLTNLIYSYQKLGYTDKSEELLQLRTTLAL